MEKERERRRQRRKEERIREGKRSRGGMEERPDSQACLAAVFPGLPRL